MSIPGPKYKGPKNRNSQPFSNVPGRPYLADFHGSNRFELRHDTRSTRNELEREG
jgi:hypothetical protein